MRQANASLVAFLASRQPFWMADLFDFALSNGTTYSWTSFDQTLNVGGTIYSANGPLVDRTRWSVKNTIDVPEMEIRIFTNGADLPGGANLKLEVHNGLFDFSTITLSRLFMSSPGNTSLGAVVLFSGQAAEIEIDAISVIVTVKGANVQLAQYMPRNRFSLGCNHALYDANCAPNPGETGGGPSRAANTFTGGINGDTSTRTVIVWQDSPQPSGNPDTFSLGTITFTSGPCAGQTRTIQAAGPNVIIVSYPFYQVPDPGDTFSITRGCDHTRAGGCTFFNNLAHFRGFPYVPPEQFAV